jgi:hypothetical protein
LNSHSELGTRSNDTCDTSLEQGPETLFLGNGYQCIEQTLVMRHAGSTLSLQSSLDTICRSGQICCRHTSDSSGRLQRQKLSCVLETIDEVWLTSNSPNESCFPCRPSWKTSFCFAKAEGNQMVVRQDCKLCITDFEMGVCREVDHTL